MPTYDYRCGTCGHQFEVFEPMSASGKRDCEKCGKAGARRLMSATAGAIFKGSGFYVTDYKPKGRSSESACAGSSEGCSGPQKDGSCGRSAEKSSATA